MAYESEIAQALNDLWLQSFADTLIPARLGVITSSTPTYDVEAERTGYVYVSLGFNGERGRATALDKVGVDTTAEWQEIRLRREKGELVIREATTLSGGGGGGSVSALDDLSDVAIASLADGHILQYDSGTGDWVNVVPPGGSGGAPSPHARDSAHHTGLEAWANIDTAGSNLTDIATRAHASLQGITANDHHDQEHVLATNTGLGADHTISGATAGHVLRASSATAAAFAQLQHDDLGGVTANQHHNQVHDIVGSDHTIDGSTFDVVGATATDTLGLLTPSADPGANAALLRTDINGGIVLQHLQVEGNVDITDGGDLTVGANVFFVDVSQESVGILRAPDPQFALDVNGPIRGTELVGKHAIQLEDLALLLHYDGGHPYNSNFTGEVNAIPLGQTPVEEARNLHFQPGKFYKALAPGYGTTNLATNPSFETNTTGWSVFNASGGNLSVSRVSTDSYFGDYCAKLTWSTINVSQFLHTPGVVTAGGNYSLGVWMRADVPTSVALRIQQNGPSFTIWGSQSVDVTEEWAFYTVSTTTTPAAGLALRVSIDPTVSGSNALYVDGVQIISAAFCVPYFDGDMGSQYGYGWSGTAHASTSTSTAGRLRYTLTDMVAHRWTIMAWLWFPHTGMTSAQRGILRMHSPSGVNDLEVYTQSDGVWAKFVHDGGTNFRSIMLSALTPGTWHHLTISYSAGTIKAYWNGELVMTASHTMSQIMDSFYVGSIGGPVYSANMFDDVVVSRKALDANRVKAIYESDAPVFAESSVFSFRATPKGLVWADEEGLWMRDSAGNAVFGIYGGAAASKSWGGVSLAVGDLLIGRSPNAYLHWDTSANQLFLHRADITLNDGINSRGELTSVGNLTLGTDITTTNGKSFQVISQGTDAGDVIIGRLAGNHLHWDQSTGTLHVEGDVLIEGSSYLTEDDLAGTDVIEGINSDISAVEGDITGINSDITSLEAAVGTTLPANIATAQAYSEIRRIAAVSGTWTSTDANTISWSGVSIRRGDGTTKSVNNGNTGNMSARTYVYTNLAAGGTLTLSTTTSVGSVPAGNTIVAVCQPGAEAADVQVIGGATFISGDNIITGSIVAAHIKGGVITADWLDAGAVTAEKIDVGTLSAIQTNTGGLDVTGVLEIGDDTSGAIRTEGKTGPADTSNAGFWMGRSGGDFQWILGNTSTGYIQNNGVSMGMFIRSAGMNVASAGTSIFNFTTSGGGGVFDLVAAEAGFPGDLDAKAGRFTYSISLESAASMYANKFDQDGDTLRVRTSRTPASAGALGLTGEWCWDANYFYVHTGTTWKRVALNTW